MTLLHLMSIKNIYQFPLWICKTTCMKCYHIDDRFATGMGISILWKLRNHNYLRTSNRLISNRLISNRFSTTSYTRYTSKNHRKSTNRISVSNPKVKAIENIFGYPKNMSKNNIVLPALTDIVIDDHQDLTIEEISMIFFLSTKMDLDINYLMPYLNISLQKVVELCNLDLIRLFEGLSNRQLLFYTSEGQQYIIHLQRLLPLCKSFDATTLSLCLNSLRERNCNREAIRKLLRLLTEQIPCIVGTFTSDDIAMAMYGLKNMSSNSIEVRSLISKLSEMITLCNENFRSDQIAKILYGLRCMRCDSIEIRHLLDIYNSKFISCLDKLNDYSLSSAIIGLCNMTSDTKEVHMLLHLLNNLIDENMKVSGRLIGNVMYGLRKMSSHHIEVQRLLRFLISSLAKYDFVMSEKELSNAIYGLQSMSSKDMEVRSLINEFTKRMESNVYHFSPQGIANAIYGLKCCSNDSNEVRLLLKQLLFQLKQSNITFKSQELANAFYGMQLMHCEDTIVLELLDELNSILRKSMDTIQLNGQEVACVLYSMQSFTNSKKEVCQLLESFANLIDKSEFMLTSDQISMALYGLKGMYFENVDESIYHLILTLTKEVMNCKDMFTIRNMSSIFIGIRFMGSNHRNTRRLIDVLASKIEIDISTSTSSNTNTSIPCVDSQFISNVLFGLQKMHSDYPEVKRLLRVMTQLIASSECSFTSQGIGNSIYGLKSLNSNVLEVQQLLRVLSLKLSSHSHVVLSHQEFANVIIGLRSFTSKVLEVRELLVVLTNHLETFHHKLETQELRCLLGLENMINDNDAVNKLLDVIVKRIPLKQDLEMKANDELVLCHSFLGLSQLHLSKEWKDYLETLLSLSERYIDARDVSDDSFLLYQSIQLVYGNKDRLYKCMIALDLDQRLENIYKKIIQLSSMTSSSRISYELDNLNMNAFSLWTHNYLIEVLGSDYEVKVKESILFFPCDFLIIESSTGRMINIELDGISYEHYRRIKFFNRRDKYLNSQGVLVKRFNLMLDHGLEDEMYYRRDRFKKFVENFL